MESTNRKVLELQSLQGKAGNRFKTCVAVTGYDNSIHEYHLTLAVKKHFSSCGHIQVMFVDRDFKSNTLKSPLYIQFWEHPGEGASDKAVLLSGTEVAGGWTAHVEAVPPRVMQNPDSIPLLRKLYSGVRKFLVSGFDTSLAEIDIQIGLCNFFSSCGEVTNVSVFGSEPAEVEISGKRGCVDKAQQLCGRDEGGMKLVFEGVVTPPKPIKGRVVGCEHPFLTQARRRIEAKMTTKEMKKMTKVEMYKMINKEAEKINTEAKKRDQMKKNATKSNMVLRSQMK